MKYFAVNLTVSDIFYVLLNINYLPKLILQIQWKCTVRGITYVCIVRICDSRKFMYNKSFLKKLLKEVGSSHIYASFGIFCVQIGQLFEAQLS